MKRLPSCSTSVSVSESRSARISGQLAEVCDAVLQHLLQHEGKETARDVPPDRVIEFMEDRRMAKRLFAVRNVCSTIVNCL